MDFCSTHPQFTKYINFCDYSEVDVALIFIGTILWIAAYLLIIYNAFKKQFVEMPVIAAAANVAWEFSWSFLIRTNLGLVFVWGLRAWFFIDLVILYCILKWGSKQYRDSYFRRYFSIVTISQVLFWIPIYYYFYKEGYDEAMGATSAYLICVLMAALYVTSFIGSDYKEHYSYKVAWLKGLANTSMTLFVFHHYSDKHFLQLMTLIVLLLNIWYIVIVARYRANKLATLD